MQSRMLGVVFEWSIVNMYENYDVVGNGFLKYIHYDLTYASRYLTIALIVDSTFVATFFCMTQCWVIHTYCKFRCYLSK